MMRAMILALLCSFFSIQNVMAANGWSTGAEINLGTSTGVSDIITPIYDTTSGQLIQIWKDVGTGHFLYYSVYNGTTWSAGVQIPAGTGPASTGVQYFQEPVTDPATGQLVLVWQDRGTGNFLFASAYNGTSWTTQKIPSGGASGVVLNAYFAPVYDPGTQQLIVVWQDSSNNLFSSAFNGSSWSTPNQILSSGLLVPMGFTEGSFAPAVYNPSVGQLVQVWQDSGSGNFLHYSTYSGSTWSAGAQIPKGSSTGVLADSDGYGVYSELVYDTNSGQLIQVWQDSGAGNKLYASAYNGTSWTTNLISSPSVTQNNWFNPIYDSSSNQIIQIWQDSSSTFYYYSSFNGSTWTAGAEIPPGTSSGISFSFFYGPFYDSTSNQLLQLWPDSGTGNFIYASSYNGSSWSTAVKIQPDGSTGVYGFRNPVYDPSSNQYVVVWADSGTGFFLYATYYNGSTWTTGVPIPPGKSTAVNNNADLVYDSFTSELVQVWKNANSSGFLYSSSYNGSSWTTGTIIPPGTSTGAYGSLDPVYDPSSNQLIQVWQDATTDNLFYSYYGPVVSGHQRAFERPNNRRP